MLAWCVLALALVGGPATALAAAKPEVGLPRTLEADVGETKGLRLMSNDLKRWHWVWLPRSATALPARLTRRVVSNAACQLQPTAPRSSLITWSTVWPSSS